LTVPELAASFCRVKFEQASFDQRRLAFCRS
jgi:hypothetical protein